MLELDVTRKHDSIENLFAKEFYASNKYPMDNETSELFIKLLLSQDNFFDIGQKEKPFLYQLLEKRLSLVHTYTLDIRTILFICFICNSAGNLVMYLWYIQYECKIRNLDAISFEIFSDIFSDGFPSHDGLLKLWTNQKVKSEAMSSDNLLDYFNAGKSLINY